MAWNASNLKLNNVEPAGGKTGATIELRIGGVGFRAGMQLMLVQATSELQGNGVVPSLSVELTDADVAATAKINLQMVAAGTYNVIAWNPPSNANGNDVTTLDGAFTVSE
ncbi:MAG: hypothetical protein V3V08_17200 [Nannocystaceae bacterium]